MGNCGRGPDVVYAECGSGWGIEQTETIAEPRLLEEEDNEIPGEPTARERLADAWGGAPQVARADDRGITAVSRPPETRLTAFIIDGVEYPTNGASGGVETVPVTGFSDIPLQLGISELRSDSPPP